MNEEEARPISGTEVGLSEPMFSPDGTSLAYFQNGQLKEGANRACCSGGSALLHDLSVYGASWNASNTIVWSQGDSIWRVSGDGSASTRIIDAAQDEQLLHPQLLPGGGRLLVTSFRAGRFATVARSLKSAEQKLVMDGAIDARYLASDAARMAAFLDPT